MTSTEKVRKYREELRKRENREKYEEFCRKQIMSNKKYREFFHKDPIALEEYKERKRLSVQKCRAKKKLKV